MNWRVEGEPKSMDVHADFAFVSRTISEKLSPLVEKQKLQKSRKRLGIMLLWNMISHQVLDNGKVISLTGNVNISDLSNVNKTLVRWSVDNRQIVIGQT